MSDSEVYEAHESPLLSQEIRDYLVNSKIEERLNDLVNQALKERPTDIYSFLSSELSKHAHFVPAINKLVATEIFDSEGVPSLEVEAHVAFKGDVRSISIEIGTDQFRGPFDPVELRDNDSSRFNGQGVLRAVDTINNSLSPALVNHDVRQQSSVDDILVSLDGTPDRSMAGVNVLASVSLCAAKAAAVLFQKPLYQHFAELYHGGTPSYYNLPLPLVTVLRTGKAYGGKLKFSEWRIGVRDIVPPQERLKVVSAVFQQLSSAVAAKYQAGGKVTASDGALIAPVDKPEEAVAFITDAITKSGFKVNTDVFIGLDMAPNGFWNAEKNQYEVTDGKPTSPDDFVEFVGKFIDSNPNIALLEDPLTATETASYAKLRDRIGAKATVVGDQLYAGSATRIQAALEQGYFVPGLSMRPVQVGTVSEVMASARLVQAQPNGLVILSESYKETTDSSVVDLAVGIGAKYIKMGPPVRGERICKYNRLNRITNQLLEAGLLAPSS
eukprot:GILI01017884.1.p1 GENE.GILI01017884.1~~GILI01017884.1.p1  ORF type:complete len:498 (-),score=95.87 GILI01017884.1:52-1545(-)